MREDGLPVVKMNVENQKDGQGEKEGKEMTVEGHKKCWTCLLKDLNEPLVPKEL
jgi:hypothetical protein